MDTAATPGTTEYPTALQALTLLLNSACPVTESDGYSLYYIDTHCLTWAISAKAPIPPFNLWHVRSMSILKETT